MRIKKLMERPKNNNKIDIYDAYIKSVIWRCL